MSTVKEDGHVTPQAGPATATAAPMPATRQPAEAGISAVTGPGSGEGNLAAGAQTASAVLTDPATSTTADDGSELTGPAPVVPAQQGLPLAFDAVAPQRSRLNNAIRVRFRLPTEDDTPPPNPRLLGMSFWAAACVFGGLLPAMRLLAAHFLGTAPQWYQVTTITLGIGGCALITAAFAAIHRAFLPWYLLASATILLLGNIAVMAVAF